MKFKIFSYPAPLWRLRALLGLFVVVVSVPPYAVFLLILVAMGLPRKTQTTFLRFWQKIVNFSLGIRYQIIGSENFDPKTPALVVSNHQSLLDIPAAFAALPNCNLRMVAKRELYQIPFFGWALKGLEFVPIDRGNRSSGREATEKISERIRSGIHVWVAPEGTRSEDGALAPFKKGSFAVAIEAQIPIQPIFVENSREALPKKSLFARSGTVIRVRVMKPVPTLGWTLERRGELAQFVRTLIQDQISQIPKP